MSLPRWLWASLAVLAGLLLCLWKMEQSVDGIGPSKRISKVKLEEPPAGRDAVLYWLADDACWSASEQRLTPFLEERAVGLANAALDRLHMGLLASDAMVGEDGVLYLFFESLAWEPAVQDECFLAQSLARTVLSDSPWLKGVRLILPEHALDWSVPLTRFELGYDDPWIAKRRSTKDRGP